MRLFASVFVAASVHALEEPGWELLVTTCEPTSRTCYKTPGLPLYAQGTYAVGGPAQFEVGHYKLGAIFDGFGMMNRFELGDGEICFTADWLETLYKSKSEEGQCPIGMLFEETDPSARPIACENPLAIGIGGDNNWVNIISIGGEAVLLSDTPLMMRMDFDTMAQPGRKQWLDDDKNGNINWTTPGRMVTTGSAHPLQRPGSEEWIAIISEVGLLHSQIHFYSVDGSKKEEQARTKLGSSGQLKHPPFMHSYGVTPNYVVMPISLGMGGGDPECTDPVIMCGIIAQWQGIHVIDKQGKLTVFDTEPFYHVHIVNSFENDTGVTLDVGGYDTSPFAISGALDIKMFLNKTVRDANPLRAVLRRVHMHFSGPLAGQATFQTFEKIAGSHTDFYRVNPSNVGLPYCFYYAAQWWHDSENYASMAITKHDLCSGEQIYWSSPDVYVGEPMLIPAPGGSEDDGVVIFVALDGSKGTSKFVMLDAKTLKEIDGAGINLDVHIPFTAHGNFIPSTTHLV